MHKVQITAIRQTVYPDLMAKYENPIEHTCDIKEGQQRNSYTNSALSFAANSITASSTSV